MNILFLSLGKLNDINENSLYTDLIRKFINKGHHVCALYPSERRDKKCKQSSNTKQSGGDFRSVEIGNITKTNFFEKTISTMMIGFLYKKAIKKYFRNIKFDMVLYATPPITFTSVIKYIKKRDKAYSYLMLKDIFPQNAVDLGMMKKTGVRSVVYKYFRKKEKKLYRVSDFIGCMSDANKDYLIKQNSYIDKKKVGLCFNSIDVNSIHIRENVTQCERIKHGIPLDRTVYIYGGNLGKPQGISHIIKCLDANLDNNEAFFVIVGDGTEFKKLKEYEEKQNNRNFKLIKKLSKKEYDALVMECDIGLIFLDYRFTIPNFPSRLLSYMQAGLPVLACTDECTDIGRIICDGDFGWWCPSNDVDLFVKQISSIKKAEAKEKSENSISYLLKNYTTENTYTQIVDRIKL